MLSEAQVWFPRPEHAACLPGLEAELRLSVAKTSPPGFSGLAPQRPRLRAASLRRGRLPGSDGASASRGGKTHRHTDTAAEPSPALLGRPRGQEAGVASGDACAGPDWA